ncbi:MAG TPA: hypothetical protein VN700_15415 [Vicinamibacterales bacterium]|nr:hypothetical protein [Vicinamibacterales bacterium]
MLSILTRLIAFLLIGEAMLGVLRLSSVLPQISFYDPVAIALIIARLFLGALQFTGGWLLASHRPAGPAIACWALIGGAAITVLDVGFRLAPSGIYSWYRWHYTIAYVVYAVIGVSILSFSHGDNRTRR